MEAENYWNPRNVQCVALELGTQGTLEARKSRKPWEPKKTKELLRTPRTIGNMMPSNLDISYNELHSKHGFTSPPDWWWMHIHSP